MTNVVLVERVANGYLVRVTPHRTGGGVVTGERLYIAAAPLDVATILEEEIWAEAGAARRVEQVAEAVVVQPTSSANLDGPGGRWPPHVHSWGPLKAIPPDGEQGRECSGCLEYQRERTDD